MTELNNANGDGQVGRHDVEAVWSALRETGSQIADLRSGQASLATEVKGLCDQIKSLVQQTADQFKTVAHQIASQRPRDVNWIGIFMIILGTLGTGAAFMQARLNPIEGNISDHKEILMSQLSEVRKEAYMDGQQQSTLDLLCEHIADLKTRMHATEAETAKNQTAVIYLGEHINAIDKSGSEVMDDNKLNKRR